MDLFAYGALTNARLVRDLTGREFPMSPAVLHGFAKVFNAATGYFVVRPAEGGAVSGKLIRALDAAALERLDRYEGRLYRRITVRARDERTGAVQPAELFIPADAEPKPNG